jgi:hypothetical protein
MADLGFWVKGTRNFVGLTITAPLQFSEQGEMVLALVFTF